MAERSGQACNRETQGAHIEYTERTGVREGACEWIPGCAELTGVREGAYKCIPGCVELIGVREGACMCIPGCVKLTGVQEGACGCIRGLVQAATLSFLSQSPNGPQDGIRDNWTESGLSPLCIHHHELVQNPES